VKIGPVVAEMFGGICGAHCCRLVKKGAVVNLIISGVTGPIFIIFAYDVATILPLNIFELELPYSYPFRNASLAE